MLCELEVASSGRHKTLTIRLLDEGEGKRVLAERLFDPLPNWFDAQVTGGEGLTFRIPDVERA